jgi:superfamily II DNA/RNA helicase
MPFLSFLVVDEADYMLNDSFIKDVKAVLFQLPNPHECEDIYKRQTIFVSATLPLEVRALALSMLSRYNTHLCTLQTNPKPPSHISHSVLPVNTMSKPFLVLKLMTDERPHIPEAIVFVRTKQRCNQTANFLNAHGIHSGKLHAQCNHRERDEVMEAFRDKSIRVLVATDGWLDSGVNYYF